MAVRDPSSGHPREEDMKTNNKSDKKVYLVAQELKLARVLAGNNKTSRDRALKSLKKWFSQRSKTLAFTDCDFERIWKGLYFSMWMSDKPLIQEECAESIASLIHFETISESLLFFKAGLTILINEWFGIDQLRLDKFLMLVRRLLRHMLLALRQHSLSKKNIDKFGEIISYTILNTDIHPPVGLFMHFTEIYLEEVAKVTLGNMPSERLVDFIRPFIKKLVVSNDGREIAHIKKFIFVYLINQSDLGIEYQIKYEAWKREGFPGTINSIQKMIVDKGSDMPLEDEIEEDSVSNHKALDPRAGRVDVELPQLKFKAKDFVNALQEHKFDKDGNTKSRKTLNELINLFIKLSNGVYPLGVKKVFDPKDLSYDTSIRKAAKRLIKFENKLLGKNKKKRKQSVENEQEKAEVPQKRRKLKQDVANSEKVESDDKFGVSKADLERFIAQSEGNCAETVKKKKKASAKLQTKSKGTDGKETNKKSNNKQKRKCLKEGDTDIAMKKNKTVLVVPEEIIDDIECIFERNSGTWIVFDDKGKVMTPSLCTDSPYQAGKSTPSFAGNEENVSGTKDSKNPPLNESSDSFRADLKNTSDKAGTSEGSESKNGMEEPNSSKSGLNPVRLFESSPQSKALFPKSSWDEPLQEGEYEICIPSKKHVAKLKKRAKKSNDSLHELINTSMKHIRGKSRVSLNSSVVKNPFSTPGSTKKVKINTKLNMSQEIHEHVRQILSSPGIPYDANKKPSKPLLKASVTSTPVNPFYSKQLSG